MNDFQRYERELNLEQLLFYAPDAVVVIDAQSTISYWNPKAEDIFGWQAREVIGKQLTQLIIPPQYRAAHEAGMTRYLATGEAHVLNRTIEITALNKQGREFYVSLTISTTYQQANIAFIAFIRDIDEQKRNALELEQKKEQLERSNQELERFAHVASHDMKEPIRKIRIFMEQLKADAWEVLSPRSKNFIERIERAAYRLNNMVEGVLAYSITKAENVVNESVDLNEVIRDVEADLELIIYQKAALIRYADLPVIEGTSFLLYQLFYNLIYNSLKFSKPAVRPVVQITANKAPEEHLQHLVVENGPYVEITVTDNSIGFSQEDADKIFTPFARLHSKDAFEGTGLGLSLCKNIVEKHKGLIRAYGEEGVGARFVIWIPEKQQ